MKDKEDIVGYESSLNKSFREACIDNEVEIVDVTWTEVADEWLDKATTLIVGHITHVIVGAVMGVLGFLVGVAT